MRKSLENAALQKVTWLCVKQVNWQRYSPVNKMATQFNMAWGHINIKIVVPTIFCKNYQNVFKVRIKGKSKTMAY